MKSFYKVRPNLTMKKLIQTTIKPTMKMPQKTNPRSLFGAENAVLRPVAYKLEGRRAERRSKAAKPGLEPRARCEASEHGEAPPFDRSEHGGTLERRGGVTPLVGLLVAKVGLAGVSGQTFEARSKTGWVRRLRREMPLTG